MEQRRKDEHTVSRGISKYLEVFARVELNLTSDCKSPDRKSWFKGNKKHIPANHPTSPGYPCIDITPTVSCTYKISREGGQWRPREDHKGKRRTHKQRHVTCRHTAIKHDEGGRACTRIHSKFHMQKHTNGEIGQDDHLQSINAELSNEVICS